MELNWWETGFCKQCPAYSMDGISNVAKISGHGECNMEPSGTFRKPDEWCIAGRRLMEELRREPAAANPETKGMEIGS